MIVSHDLKLIFIHTHRTAGTTLSNLLVPQLVNNFDIHTQHTNVRTLEATFIEKYKEYYFCGFTRNPWERILSWYSLIYFKDQKSIPEERKRFEKFLETDAASDFTSQFFHYNTLDYFSNTKGEVIVDKILHYADLKNEIKVLFNHFNLSLSEIPLINETSSKNYRDYYTDKSIDLIAQKCEKDIHYFNYTF
jgi:hypothetical protein